MIAAQKRRTYRNAICAAAVAVGVASVGSNVARADDSTIVITETGTLNNVHIFDNPNSITLPSNGASYTDQLVLDSSDLVPAGSCTSSSCNYNIDGGTVTFLSGSYSFTTNILPGFSGLQTGVQSGGNGFTLSAGNISGQDVISILGQPSPIPDPTTVTGSVTIPVTSTSGTAGGISDAVSSDGTFFSAFGSVSSLTISEATPNRPIPPSVLNSTTYTPPPTAPGTITILGTGEAALSGTLGGAPITGLVQADSQGTNQVGNAFTFSTALGTLNSSQVSLAAIATLTPTVTTNGGTSPAYTVGLNITGNTSLNFGGSNAQISYPTYTAPCDPVNCAAGSSTAPEYVLLTDQQTVDGTTNKNGGPIPITVTPTVTAGSGTIDGNLGVSVQANTAENYTPFSTQTYLQNALNQATGATNADKAQSASQYLTALREWDAATSSQNLNLRDAEYFDLGFVGGQALLAQGATSNPSWYNAILGTGPVAVLGWKAISDPVTAVSGSLPGTSGGYLADFNGLVAGLENESVQQAVDNYGNNATSPGAGTKADPITPLLMLQGTTTDGKSFVNSLFGFSVTAPNTTLDIDPEFAEFMRYAFAGNEVTGFDVSDIPDGGQLFYEDSGQDYLITAGDFFDLTKFDPDGLDDLSFYWTGAPGGDLDIDFQFADADPTILDVTTSNDINVDSNGRSQNVPEPGSLGLLMSGLFCLRAAECLRRRRSISKRNQPT